MSGFEVVRSPEIIATEINSFKDHTRSVVLLASVEIGKRLIEAKELLPHGEWGPWLESNVDYSQSTAGNLMQLFQEYGENPQSFGNLSYSNAVALIGIAPEEREQFVADNDVENMSSRELQKVIKEKKKLEKEIAENEDAVNVANAERDLLLKSNRELVEKLSEAESSGVDAEEIESLKSNLANSQSKIKQLETDLKSKPIEAAAVEYIPDYVEKELADLRGKLSAQGDPSELTFRLRFESLVGEFKNVLEALDGVSDPVARSKYSKAVSGLINKMDATLPQHEEIIGKEFERQQVTIFDEMRTREQAAQQQTS